jgi:hypothetical protein
MRTQADKVKNVLMPALPTCGTTCVAAIFVEFTNEKLHIRVSLLHVALKTSSCDENAGDGGNRIPNWHYDWTDMNQAVR